MFEKARCVNLTYFSHVAVALLSDMTIVNIFYDVWFHFNPAFYLGSRLGQCYTDRSFSSPKKQQAKMAADSAENEDPLAGIPSFHDFTQSTTFHGVSYIFEGRFRFRK